MSQTHIRASYQLGDLEEDVEPELLELGNYSDESAGRSR